MNRRGFLQILSAAIAAPVIARAALVPDLILPPGIKRIESVTKPMIMTGDHRFANAAFTPGGEIRAIADALRMKCPLPAGTFYQIRALQMSPYELGRAMGRHMPRGYNRGGWAVMWVTDASMQRGEHSHLAGSELLGTYQAGPYLEIDYTREPRVIGLYEGNNTPELHESDGTPLGWQTEDVAAWRKLMGRS